MVNFLFIVINKYKISNLFNGQLPGNPSIPGLPGAPKITIRIIKNFSMYYLDYIIVISALINICYHIYQCCINICQKNQNFYKYIFYVSKLYMFIVYYGYTYDWLML